MNKDKTLFGILSTILTGSLLLALVAYIYIALFSRYLADDYCYVQVVINKGFLTAQKHWYMQWTDKFSSTLITGVSFGNVGDRSKGRKLKSKRVARLLQKIINPIRMKHGRLSMMVLISLSARNG